ncbi:hypothetical protein ACQR10_04560 [Bradyrhizobium sp. HKCCYLRH2060]|uniref:hypothetical protein n=1 Tax=Bradyrhizobium sp. HKCCYLRH2060 TaxID=3420743 RepID=UPI003EBCFC0D
MTRVFDVADYRRRLDQADDLSTGEELRLILKGASTGQGLNYVDARRTMITAKQDALRRARKELVKRLRQEDDRIRSQSILPVDITEWTETSGDELVKLP